ncbi:MAG: glucosaminidase domain-containing protein [Spirochaetaceae bacterium]|jgi:hypothetical protein|nr:glucosaminidase domain-containing protein [Spirochaetaceae bacterium]
MRFFIPLFLWCCVLQLSARPPRSLQKPAENTVLPPPAVFILPQSAEEPAEETPVPDGVLPEKAAADITIHEIPGPPRPILGTGKTGPELLLAFLLSENKNTDRTFAEQLVGLYIAEAETEGVNHDIAFAQMCLETGFLRFGGLVRPEMNNFCGLGSIGPGEPGEQFPTAQIGVRAHIQHLKAYATDLPLTGELVDPRYRFVRPGSSPAVQGLAGTWAADKLYAEKIEAILARMYRFPENENPGKN